MIYNNVLEVLDEYYSSAPDGSIGGLVVAKNKVTGSINFYLASRNRYTTEKQDINYFLSFGTKIPIDSMKFFVKQIEEREKERREKDERNEI